MAYKRRKRRRRYGWFVSLALIVLSVLGYLFASGRLDFLFGGSSSAEPVEGIVEFHFIDVGQGDAALIRTEEGNVLIDAGTNASEDELLAYLRKEGITEIAFAVFTHPHEDHIGGADAILEYCIIEKIIMPNVADDHDSYDEMMTAIRAEGAEVIYAQPETVYTLGDLVMTVLGPVSSGYKDMNNDSVVLRVDFGESSVIYTGDAEDVSEKEMLERYAFSNKLDCDLLKVGHHGAQNSTTEDFLRAVSPEIAVISCGEGNRYGHPRQAVLDRLDSYGTEYFRTDLLGDIVFISDGTTLEKE